MDDLDKNTCLHCGTGEPGYCEECYQELISKNMKLQRQNDFIISTIKDKIQGWKFHIVDMERAGQDVFEQQIFASTIRMCTLTNLLDELGIEM